MVSQLQPDASTVVEHGGQFEVSAERTPIVRYCGVRKAPRRDLRTENPWNPQVFGADRGVQGWRTDWKFTDILDDADHKTAVQRYQNKQSGKFFLASSFAGSGFETQGRTTKSEVRSTL